MLDALTTCGYTWLHMWLRICGYRCVQPPLAREDCVQPFCCLGSLLWMGITFTVVCRPVRATDCCEKLCHERYEVHSRALPHIVRLAGALPTIHIDADGPLEEVHAHAREAVAAFQAARRERLLRGEFLDVKGRGGARRGGGGRGAWRAAAGAHGPRGWPPVPAHAARGRCSLAAFGSRG